MERVIRITERTIELRQSDPMAPPYPSMQHSLLPDHAGQALLQQPRQFRAPNKADLKFLSGLGVVYLILAYLLVKELMQIG